MVIENKNTIYITGSSGFVGKNLIKYFENIYKFSKYEKGNYISINQDIVIHLAGKAHDLKNVSDTSEYYSVNTEFTKQVFDSYLSSDASVFIILSSVKAVADEVRSELFEDFIPNPVTHYGKSKLLAEQYILSKNIPKGKRIYILRPCMLHGVGNKGNLNLLFKIVSKGLPWPLGAFENKRSFCSIDNLCFVIKELIDNKIIESGIYNISDDEPLSTNQLIKIIANSRNKRAIIYKLPPKIIHFLVIVSDLFKLPLNTERFKKLTENYIVSNKKIKSAIGKPFPFTTKEGLIKTLTSFNI